VCHFGPGLSNGEFHDVAIPFLIEPGRVDSGRYSGVRRVKSDPFNLLSIYNDQSVKSGNQTENPSKNQSENQPERLPESLKTNTVQLAHRNWGEWKTPSLRNLKTTAPYMHNGSLRTLRDVARHYSEINEERLHSDGERLLKPLRLSPREISP
jgi:cytochrome c peroxidase